MGCRKHIPFLFWRKWAAPKTNSFFLAQKGDAQNNNIYNITNQNK